MCLLGAQHCFRYWQYNDNQDKTGQLPLSGGAEVRELRAHLWHL